MENLFCLLLYIVVVAVTKAQTGENPVTETSAPVPPSIYLQPEREMFFKDGELVRLQCKATGFPKPTYTWKRNGVDFNPSGNDDRVIQMPDEGTLEFTGPENKDGGIYQCFAHNAYGTSASVKVDLRMARLEHFPQRQDEIKSPQRGSSLTLDCMPPESVPTPEAFWAIKTLNSDIRPIILDDRVTMDLEYRLHFAHVTADDFQDGSAYVCVAINMFTRTAVESHQHFIRPHGPEKPYPTSFLWSSPEDAFGLRGTELKLKCIFGGNPTPEVHWERTDGAPMSNETSVESYGQELVIKNLQYEDAGTYDCWGINSMSRNRSQRRITVRVESVPVLLQEPQDVEASVGESVEVSCTANAVPEPTYLWYINGVPLDGVMSASMVDNPSFLRPRPDQLLFRNLTAEDTMVIQCNATNRHGYAWIDVYLNVQSTETIPPRPPGIYVQPERKMFFKAGEYVRLQCVANGFPKPTYTWKRNGVDFDPSGNDDHVIQVPHEGTLEFTRPENKDEGIYQCFAHNAHGTSASVKVDLRMARLEHFPQRQDEVRSPQVSSPLTLNCLPPESVPTPVVLWAIKAPHSHFRFINLDDRVTMDHEYRLRFVHVTAYDFQDGSAYVCLAMNQITRSIVQSHQHFIRPQGATEKRHPTSYLWSSPQDAFGLRGTELKLKCIFAGNPTPEVHWERTDGAPMGNETSVESYGQELVIKNLQYEDAGTYECWGINYMSMNRSQRRIAVRVESVPELLQEPQDVEASVGESAEINCTADAVPEPTYLWYINGVPLDDVMSASMVDNPSFLRPRPDQLLFRNLTVEDTMVIQCNATNRHGYAWMDVYLNVQ